MGNDLLLRDFVNLKDVKSASCHFSFPVFSIMSNTSDVCPVYDLDPAKIMSIDFILSQIKIVNSGAKFSMTNKPNFF